MLNDVFLRCVFERYDVSVVLDAAAAALDARSDRATWLKRNPGVDERCGTNALHYSMTNRREAHMTVRLMWDRTRETRHTDQFPHHAAARCCATPCCRPSAASAASGSLSPRAHPSRDLLGAKASGRNALHGETFLCRSHHVVRRLENTCDLREMWLVVHGCVIMPVYASVCNV